jgi:hypothetical protein
VVKRFFLGLSLLVGVNFNLAALDCIKKCFPCLSARRKKLEKRDEYILKYIIVKLDPIYEHQRYQERSWLGLGRFLDCCNCRNKRKNKS